MKLLRSFMRNKWEENRGKSLEDYLTDPITKCTKTMGNTLSVWAGDYELDFSEEDVLKLPTETKELIVAFAASMQRPDSIDLIWLDGKKLTEQNIDLRATPGDTKFLKMVDSHRDIDKLTFSKLGIVSEHLVNQLDDNKNYCRVTKNELLKLVVEVSRLNEEFKLDSLKPDWAKHIEKFLANEKNKGN